PLEPELRPRPIHYGGSDLADAVLPRPVGVDALDDASHERRHVAEPFHGVRRPGHALGCSRLGIEEHLTAGCDGRARQLHRLSRYGAAADLHAEAADELRLHRIRQHGHLTLARRAGEYGGHGPIAGELALG